MKKLLVEVWQHTSVQWICLNPGENQLAGATTIELAQILAVARVHALSNSLQPFTKVRLLHLAIDRH